MYRLLLNPSVVAQFWVSGPGRRESSPPERVQDRLTQLPADRHKISVSVAECCLLTAIARAPGGSGVLGLFLSLPVCLTAVKERCLPKLQPLPPRLPLTSLFGPVRR